MVALVVPHVWLTALSVEDKLFFNPFFITNLVLQEASAGVKSSE